MNYQQMSLQELFDISYTHIIKQGCSSTNYKDECLYRGYDGITCAAGPFLSDDEVREVLVDSLVGICNCISTTKKRVII